MNDTYTPAKKGTTARPVSEVLAGWPTAPFQFRFDGGIKLRVILVAAILILSMILSTILLIGGRDIYFHFTPKPQREESEGGVASEKGDFPYADGIAPHRRLFREYRGKNISRDIGIL